MRRYLGLAAAWLAVAVGSVMVAWQGVRIVGDQVTDRRPAPLTAAEIESRLAEQAPTTPSGPGGGATPSPTAAPARPPATTPTTAATPGTTATTAAAPATTPAGTAPPTTAPGETRTYNLVGGTASLRFAPGGVTVVFANPAPGFSVETEAEHGNGVKVEFESEGHDSRVDGWWDGGPVDRVREEPED